MTKVRKITARLLALLSEKGTIDNKPWNLITSTIVMVWLSEVLKMSIPDIITFLRGRKIEHITSVDLSKRIRHSLKVIRGFGPIDPKYHDPIVGEILTAVFGHYRTSSNEQSFTFPGSCPHCSSTSFSGKMLLGRDYYGQFASCINCGHVSYPISTPTSTGEEISRRPVHAKNRLD